MFDELLALEAHANRVDVDGFDDSILFYSHIESEAIAVIAAMVRSQL
jgi:hypothetical protein